MIARKLGKDELVSLQEMVVDLEGTVSNSRYLKIERIDYGDQGVRIN